MGKIDERHRHWIEAVVAIAVVAVAMVLAAEFDLLERWTRFSAAHESLELDELPMAIALAALALSWFGYRRWREGAREVSRRIEANERLAREIRQREQVQQALQAANERLSALVEALERRDRENVLLAEMGNLLQLAATTEESHGIVSRFMTDLFPSEPGGVYVFNASRNALEAVARWGEPGLDGEELEFGPGECWALRRGTAHVVTAPRAELLCAHVSPVSNSATLCLPMLAQGETLGVFHLRPTVAAPALAPAKAASFAHTERLATTVAENIALALANNSLRERLRVQSIRDPLTGLYNRRYLEESMERELRRAVRHQHPLGVITFDIDHFKRFNDTFGHDAGDVLLRILGRYVSSLIRAEDTACRYGGEEFVLLLPNSSAQDARQRADEFRRGVRDLHVKHRGQSLGAVTVSLGVAAFPEHGANAEDLMRASDQALIRAKRAGRDRVVVAEPAKR